MLRAFATGLTRMETATKGTEPPRLAETLATRLRRADHTRFVVGEDWLFGRSAFGGLVGVLAMCAIRDEIGQARPLRAMQVNFVGAVGGGPVDVAVSVLRNGKSVTQVSAVVHYDGQPACHVQAVFGESRETTVPVMTDTRPPVRPADEVAAIPFIEGVTPGFGRHFDIRWAQGGPPHSGADATCSKIWLMLHGESIDPELLCILFADAMPNPVMAGVRDRAFSASLAWSLEFLPAAHAPVGEGWWRADTAVTGYAQGYANQRTIIWAPSGEPAAFSQQVVAVYA